jgi:hypothetical protein
MGGGAAAFVAMLPIRRFAEASAEAPRLAGKPLTCRQFAAMVPALGQLRFHILDACHTTANGFRQWLPQPGVLSFHQGITFL